VAAGPDAASDKMLAFLKAVLDGSLVVILGKDAVYYWDLTKLNIKVNLKQQEQTAPMVEVGPPPLLLCVLTVIIVAALLLFVRWDRRRCCCVF